MFQCQRYRQKVNNSATVHWSSPCFTSALASLRSKRLRCGLGAKNEERKSKATRKMKRVKERGVSGSFHICATKTKNPVPRRSSVFLCSDTMTETFATQTTSA